MWSPARTKNRAHSRNKLPSSFPQFDRLENGTVITINLPVVTVVDDHNHNHGNGYHHDCDHGCGYSA
jgi:hypothetical protein